MSKTDIDLKKAAADRDMYAIQCFVVDQQNLLLKGWHDSPDKEFHYTLQRLLQKSRRVKQQLVAPEGEIPYQLGVWNGWIQVFHTLYDERNQENDMIRSAVAKSPNTEKIIRFLYQYERPICHGELADALEVHYSALTNAMKRVIGCGAVSASRTGRNTRYVLTPAAKRYCREEIKWEKVLPKNKETLLLEELIKTYRSKEKEISALVGDYVRVSGITEEGVSDRRRLTKITQIGAEKLLDLEPADDNIPIFDADISDISDIDIYISPLLQNTASCADTIKNHSTYAHYI